jgi:hypothetical protein
VRVIDGENTVSLFMPEVGNATHHDQSTSNIRAVLMKVLSPTILALSAPLETLG